MAAETASAGGVWAVALPSFVIGALLALWAGRRHWQALAALRRSRDELRRLEEMLDLWQWRSDAGHRLLMLKAPPGSAAASEDTTGTLLWERFTGTDAASLRSQLDGRLPLQDVEARFAPAQGGPMRRVRLQGRACVDDSGAFAGYAGTLRLLDDPLPAAPDASAETERESFSYTVSHDLRAPIRVVEGFTKIVKEDYGRLLDRVGNDHLDRVLGAAARMNSMIDALLALSQLSAKPVSRQPVNLSQLAGFVVDDLRRPMAATCGQDAHRPGDAGPRRSDPVEGGARKPARQRLEVHRQVHRTGGVVRTLHRLHHDELHGTGQRSRVRHAIRRPFVRRVSAPAQRHRIPGHRRGSGLSTPHRAEAWRRGVGRVRGGPGRELPLLARKSVAPGPDAACPRWHRDARAQWSAEPDSSSTA
jgi:signal transduction histidine kinase